MTTNIEVDETNIKDVIRAFEDILNNLDKYAQKTSEKIIREGLKHLDNNYSKRFKDPNITDINTRYEKIDDGYELISEGKDVVYEEFGTGDEGETHPHDEKSTYESQYGLKKYNSGSYIRDVSSVEKGTYTYEDLQEIGITGGKFWQYEKNGTVYYTQGVPAGQEMWDTRNHIIKEIIPKAEKELGVELREKFEKAIKK